MKRTHTGGVFRITTHGMWKSKEWNSWDHMKRRCNNPNDPKYPLYGARGITVCERWNTFANFFEDMGFAPSKSHSLDRFPDNNGNYEISNCRWATPKEQANNRRVRKKETVKRKVKTLITKKNKQNGINTRRNKSNC